MVNEVIPTFDISQSEQLTAEARKWRLPYWDWAARKPRGDKKIYDAALILKDETVTVFTSTGEATTIPNPLWRYRTAKPMGEWGIKPLAITEKVSSDAAVWYDLTRTLDYHRLPRLHCNQQGPS